MGFFRIPLSLRALVAALVFLCTLTAARAQVLDDIEWRRVGNDAVLQIRFAVPIQFLRSVISASSDQAQAFYELRPRGELPQLVIAERRAAPSDGLPAVSVSDQEVLGVLNRKVVIRFDRPVPMRVRAGRSNCCIDVIVIGAGAAADVRNAAPAPARPIEDRFLITLQSSADPNLRMEVPVPGQLQAYQLFTARRVVDGRTVYEINLGYFTTREEAERALRVLKPRFPQSQVVELTPQTPPAAVAAVREPAPPPAPPPAQAAQPQAAPAQPAPSTSGAVEHMPAPPPVPVLPLPPATPSIAPPAPPTGPAPAPAPAPAPQPAPAPPAPQPVPVTPAEPGTNPAAPVFVTPATPPGEATAPTVAATPGGAPPPAAPPQAHSPATTPPPPPSAPAEIDQQGRVLLAQGRAAMDKGDYEQAVGLLNQLLNLPPNTASQDGQELIGVARARLGDVTRARVEFELYLKLYPTGPGAERVRAELAKLGTGTTVVQRRVRPATPIDTFYGSFSQYYFGGRSQITQLREGTPLQGVPVSPTQDPISTVDQKQLQSSLDLSYRHRDADRDIRAVFRDVYTKNFLDSRSGLSRRPPNRLYAAYVDYRALPTGFVGKLGRQSPSGGDGVLYRFDGARVGYQVTPQFGLYGVAGEPSDDLYDAKRRFYGLSASAENLFDRLSASLYGIQQTIDGETDRRAAGTEVRFFTPQTSIFGTYDYDVLFHALNIASLQATWQAQNNVATVTALVDRRTGPILTTGNALLVPDSTGAIHRTVTDYLQTLTIDQVRQLAKATTTYIDQKQLGVTVSVSNNVQVAGNVSRTNIGALPAFDPSPSCLQDPNCIPLVPAQPATGNIDSYGLQFIASNLYSERDSHVLSSSFLKGATFKGRQFAYNNLTTLAQNWQLEPSLKYFLQNNNDGTRNTRLTPALRVSWRLARKLSIEGDVEYEMSKFRQPDPSTGQTAIEKANRTFFFLGYRLEF